MRVIKLLTKDGRVFYGAFTNEAFDNWLSALESQAEERHGGAVEIQVVSMSPEEYNAIPTTVSAAALFQGFPE